MKTMQTDLQDAVRGDRPALKRVLDAHWPQIRRWALIRCGEVAMAEDAAQESVVRLLRFIHQYDPSRPFGPWLKTLVHRACHDQRAKRGAVAESCREIGALQPYGRKIDMDRMAERVIRAFASLTERQRQIMTRVDLEHALPSEVAVELGLSAGAIRNQLFSARKRIRAQLPDHEILPLLRQA